MMLCQSNEKSKRKAKDENMEPARERNCKVKKIVLLYQLRAEKFKVTIIQYCSYAFKREALSDMNGEVYWKFIPFAKSLSSFSFFHLLTREENYIFCLIRLCTSFIILS